MVVKTFRDYSNHVVTSVLGNLARMGGDQYLSTVDPAELIRTYYEKYSLPRLVLLQGGTPHITPEKTTSKHSEKESAKMMIRFDVEVSPRIEKSLSLALEGQEDAAFQTDNKGFIFRENLHVDSAQQRRRELSQQIGLEVSRRNIQIDATNTDFRTRITDIIIQRHSNLKQQDETISRLAQLIPIEFRAEPTAPVVPLKKKREIVINPPKQIATFQSRIRSEILNAIIDILIRGGRTFETTPETFTRLQEEDLRNLLISFLNGNFEIRAVGEAFNKLGKTDISLTFSGNNLFVTECKFWDGHKKYLDAIDQLFGYLTWRESIGVLVFFVQEKDFSAVIEKSKEATQNHPSFLAGSLRTKDTSYFVSTHMFPEDSAKQIEVHHLLFHIPANEKHGSPPNA